MLSNEVRDLTFQIFETHGLIIRWSQIRTLAATNIPKTCQVNVGEQESSITVWRHAGSGARRVTNSDLSELCRVEHGTGSKDPKSQIKSCLDQRS
jgi:hypothetical protein